MEINSGFKQAKKFHLYGAFYKHLKGTYLRIEEIFLPPYRSRKNKKNISWNEGKALLKREFPAVSQTETYPEVLNLFPNMILIYKVGVLICGFFPCRILFFPDVLMF